MSIIPPAKRAHISSHFLDVKAGGGEDGEPPDAGEEEERGLDGDAAPYPAQSGHHGEEAHFLPNRVQLRVNSSPERCL